MACWSPLRMTQRKQNNEPRNKTMSIIKIKAENIALQESGLYSVSGEDETLYVYDIEIVAYVDGKKYVLRNYLQKGATYAEYDVDADCGGCFYVNHDARPAAIRFAERIVRRGVIDLDRWDEVEEQSLGERLAYYAHEEELERRGLSF